MNAPPESCERRTALGNRKPNGSSSSANGLLEKAVPMSMTGALLASLGEQLDSGQAEQTGTERDRRLLWELEKSGDEGVRPQAAITRRRV